MYAHIVKWDQNVWVRKVKYIIRVDFVGVLFDDM